MTGGSSGVPGLGTRKAAVRDGGSMQVDQPNQVHPTSVDAFSECVRRIRLEYTEMPGLHLSKCQARRLWNLDSRSCDVLFEALEASHFLRRVANDSYARVDIGVDRVSTVMHCATCHGQDGKGQA